MRKPYVAVVAVTAGAHLAYLLYVPSGGFLALRWPRTIVLHVPAVAWGVAVVALRLRCPLTSVESWARRRAEMDPLPASGFIDRYVTGYLVPPGRVGAAQALAFTAAVMSWGVFARRGIGPGSRGVPTTG
ncbi:DUF2784 domain-containing protein [Mycobacterium colombiense]|uniref:DUF2784 domain-containing protein n=1 Tax=Mycobacterium colombiense TaxID=339268 RepID=A0A1A2Z6J6_9MYCO|nr:DUF2784 domain-containing protein [Mycobacterium colombiense]OBI45273.1 hypothetical protein A5708_14835 [Mycobacterium colombiense]